MGPAGTVLNRALKQAKLVRSELLVANVVGTRPLGDEWTTHNRGDIARGIADLGKLLSAAPRTLIVALGEQALHVCLGLDPDAKQHAITEVRGYVFHGPFGPVLACAHPAFILRQWVPWWATFCWDLQKAKRILDGGPTQSVGSELWAHDPATGLEFLPQAATAKRLAVDIETKGSGLQVEPLCIGFSCDRKLGLCLPWKEDFLPAIRALLGTATPKVFQNGQFDVTVLERHGMEVRNWEKDTMLLWHVVEPLLAGKQEGKKGKRTEKSLRFLVSLLCDGQSFYKDYNFQTEEDRYLLCARDARLTLEICEKLEQRLCDGAGYGENAA